MSIEITLTTEEMAYAAEIGMNSAANQPALPPEIPPSAILGRLIEQAGAELAVAKYGRLQEQGTILQQPGAYEVRYGPCAVFPDDPDDLIIVNVTGKGPSYSINGWIRAGDAKRPEYLCSY